MKKYTVDDIIATLNVSKRTAQRYLENLVNKEDKKHFFKKDIFDLIISRHNHDTITTEENDNNLITEAFTEEEYQEFHKRLSEYPFLKDKISDSENHLKDIISQLDYLKNAYNKQLEIHEKLILSINEKEKNQRIMLNNVTQRNYIEAKEKGYDGENK